MTSLALEVVGQLEIPAAALAHRFVLEGLRLLEIAESNEDEHQRVVGTDQDSSRVQLYGWAKDIAVHTDDYGVVYGACLSPGTSTLLARAEEGEELAVELSVGTVFRLDDRVPHWTRDSASRLAVFVGPFEAPCDAEAVERLRTAVEYLVEGRYQDAPRVASGLVQLQSDERWVTANFEGREIMLLSDAKAGGYHILDCSCGEPAAVIDEYWPYHWDGNLCRDCR